MVAVALSILGYISLAALLITLMANDFGRNWNIFFYVVSLVITILLAMSFINILKLVNWFRIW